MQHWYAVFTKPHKERQVQALLTGRGMETYYPVVSGSTPRHSTDRAFFPRYLFVHVDLEAVGLWSVHYTPGMCGLVMYGNVPVCVEDQWIAILRERLAQMAAANASSRRFERGDPVHITSGPLAEMDAIFDQRLSGAERVSILIRLFNRWTKIEIDSEQLCKTNKIPSQRDRFAVSAYSNRATN